LTRRERLDEDQTRSEDANGVFRSGGLRLRERRLTRRERLDEDQTRSEDANQ
jgi:hypothetical protein